ncbi:hypothetical protein Tco_1219663 [Tanacetum coccineum]
MQIGELSCWNLKLERWYCSRYRHGRALCVLESARNVYQRYIGPFKFLARVGPIAYTLELPEKLKGIHSTFHVSNLKKCLVEGDIIVPMNEIQPDDKFHMIEEPVEVVDREVRGSHGFKMEVILANVMWLIGGEYIGLFFDRILWFILFEDLSPRVGGFLQQEIMFGLVLLLSLHSELLRFRRSDCGGVLEDSLMLMKKDKIHGATSQDVDDELSS